MKIPDWQWDEIKQVGTDFANVEEVRFYDERMSRVRNVRSENQAIIDRIRPGMEQIIVEIGTGTGGFARMVARECAKVHAVDVSPAMLEYAEEKAKEDGADNIEFHHGGFLTYEHNDREADTVVSQLALHHLPDLWKAAALERIAAILKPGGTLFLGDAIFEWGDEGRDEYFHQITGGEKGLEEEMSKRLKRHIANEFSTQGWIMEGLLERAGFTIEQVGESIGFIKQYLCRKCG